MGRVDRVVAFDTETTSADPETARIITAFIGVYDRPSDGWVEEHYFLLNPRVPIDPGATAVHGYSAEDLEMAGSDAKRGIFDMVQRLDILQRQGLPGVVFNARFDYTLLDREQARHYPGMRPFEPTPVLDPFVLDKAVEPYRKGKRKLVDVAARYGVPVEENAHDASADCLMAARLACLLTTHRQFVGRTLQQMHDFQVKAAATQAASLATYFRKQDGNSLRADTVRPEWPLVPRTEITA